MKYSQAEPGRVFVIRLEDGEILHEMLEDFAVRHQVTAASLIALGAADAQSVLTTGPEEDRALPVVPRSRILEHVHEVCGTGTIFPDKTGKPVLHMHLACGRGSRTITGCVRQGVKVWHVMEVVMTEMTGTTAGRAVDPVTGFELLEP